MIKRRILAPLGASIAILMIACGCTVLPFHARVQLEEAGRAYQGNDLRTANTKLDGVIEQYPQCPETAEAYYIRALCRIKAGRPTEAQADLAQCLRLSQRTDLTGRARATLGGLEQDAGKLEAAAESFDQALRTLPEVPPTDQVRYRYAVCLQRLGRWDESRSLFSSVIQQYPRSPYAEDARRRFSWKEPFFSIQCGAFVNATQAENIVRKLRQSNPETWKEPEARFGKPMYVVYSGKYDTYTQAQEGLRSARREYPGAYVVP